MGNIATVVALVVGAMAIIGAVVATVVFVKGSYGKARMEALREDNDDLRKRISDLDRDIDMYQEQEEVAKSKIAHLEGENELLRELALQRADVSDVRALLETHDDRVKRMYEDVVKKLKELHNGQA